MGFPPLTFLSRLLGFAAAVHDLGETPKREKLGQKRKLSVVFGAIITVAVCM
jgi:hypothetical protein